MILQTMTPKEKCEQMVKLAPSILALANRDIDMFVRRLWRAKRFPTFIVTPEIEVTGMGRWRMVIEGESKSSVKKGVACIKAYQTFHVTHSKNPLNNGTGIYLFNADDYGNVQCQEFPPHYFNRLRERLIEPKGIVQPDFHHLVVEMMRMHGLSMDVVIKGLTVKKGEDGKYDFTRDHSIDRKEGYENFISYHKEGVSLGVASGGKSYCNFTTFVPNGLLREGQAVMQRRMLADIRKHEYRKQGDPFATYDKTEFLDKDLDY